MENYQIVENCGKLWKIVENCERGVAGPRSNTALRIPRSRYRNRIKKEPQSFLRSSPIVKL